MLKLLSVLLLTFSTPAFQSAAFFGSNFAPSSASAITYIASAIGSGSGGTGTTSTSLNVVAGDKLAVYCVTNGGNNTISLSDTIGNTFGKGTHQNDGSIGNSDIFWTYSSGSNAADFITCTNNNGANPQIVALQYHGGLTSGAADAHDNAAGSSGGWTTISFNTTTANEVVVQCLTADRVPNAGPIGGFTANVRVAGGTFSPYCQDYIFTATQTGITAETFLSSVGEYNGQMVTLP